MMKMNMIFMFVTNEMCFSRLFVMLFSNIWISKQNVLHDQNKNNVIHDIMERRERHVYFFFGFLTLRKTICILVGIEPCVDHMVELLVSKHVYKS